MHEDLLGYLLGALEPHEMCRVEKMLKEDPVLRKQLTELEQALKPLEHNLEPAIDPVPTNLVSRTMAGIPSLTSEQASSDRASRSTFDSLIPLHPEIEIGKSNHGSFIDWVGGVAAAAAILGLLLPSLAEGRFEARRVACQAQLRQLGTAITQFVNRDRQHRLPAVAESGPEAFAGVYAPRLSDAGLLPDPSLRWCPSRATPKKSVVTLTPITLVGSVADLHRASPDRLRQIQQYAGGHRAYNVGVVDGQRFESARFQSRASFAVMSDAPQAGFANREDVGRLTGHGGEGINVLFEDGHVQFIAVPTLNAMPDHPLLNNRGRAEAGVNIDDASLAPSWVAPFFNAVQR
jgi:hypothetical protein